MNDADRSVVELAARQRQVFTRDQALAAGLSAAALRRRVKTGQLVRYGSRTFHFTGATLGYYATGNGSGSTVPADFA